MLSSLQYRHRLVFVVPLFLSAFLLFVIQPMVGKKILPWFGGVPMVWTVCMLYFQLVLLASYLYAVLITRLRNLQLQQILHSILLVLSLLSLPILWHHPPAINHHTPSLSLLSLLSTQLSLPLLTVGATAPLLQYWFSRTNDPQARDPYFLYSASNAGSLLALLSYPFIIERFAGLQLQSQLWSSIFFLFSLILLALCIKVNYHRNALPESVKHDYCLPKLQQYIQWIYLSFIPVSLMLGVTTFITTDIASTPLLWILPLALYLLTYILTFSRTRLISHQWVTNNVLFFLIFGLLSFIIGSNLEYAIELISIHLAMFFILSMLCHGELVSSRPPSFQLTHFYLSIALGGVLAGVFNGLIAPVIFNQAYEYPIAIILSLLILPRSTKEWKWNHLLFIILLCSLNHILLVLPKFFWLNQYPAIMTLCVVLIVLSRSNQYQLALSVTILFFFHFFVSQHTVLWQGRNFFGIKKILAQENIHALISQTTLHGLQIMDGSIELNKNLLYYQPSNEVAQALKGQVKRVAVIGSGVGIIACQYPRETALSFYEIDPQIVAIANKRQFFSLFAQCHPQSPFIVGDGRLQLQRQKNAHYDVIILDAFNSDSVPIHLLTEEALNLYRQKITSKGSILLHISNRHLNLLPIVTTYAQNRGLQLLFKQHQSNKQGQFSSDWVLISKNQSLINTLKKLNWRQPKGIKDIIWTDDYSNILPLIKFKP